MDGNLRRVGGGRVFVTANGRVVVDQADRDLAEFLIRLFEGKQHVKLDAPLRRETGKSETQE